MNRILTRFTAANSPWPWISVAVLAVLPHLQILANPFAYDDWYIIPENPYMWHPHALRKAFEGNVWSFVGEVGISNYYRPMMHLFNYAIYQAFGPDPGWFHFFCLLLHMGVALMVVAVTRHLSGSREAGFVAGLLFAVHPVHSEVVAWIACSPELLASFFSLLSIYLYLKATRDETITTRRVLLAAAMGGSLLIAQLSKEIGALVAVIIVAYELLVCRRGPLWQIRHRWLEYGSLTVATLVYMGLRIWGLGALIPYGRRESLPALQHLWTAFAVFYRYLGLLFWPWELNYFRFYDPNHGPFEALVVAGMLCFAAFVGLGVWLYLRRAPETLAIPFYFLALLPTLQLPYVFTGMLVIERSLYLPSVAFCWLAAVGLIALARRVGSRPVAVFTAVLLVAWAGRSAVRMYDWHDEIGLFRDGLRLTPDNFHLHSYYGKILQRHDRNEEAIQHLERSLKLKQGVADVHNTLGGSYFMLGKTAEAWQHYRRAAEISEAEGDRASAARAWNNMGIVHRSGGQNAQAIIAYRRAIELDPRFSAARNNLGYVLLLENDVDGAMAQLRAALAEDPTLPQAYANLGLAYAIRREYGPALAALADAERLAPQNAEVHARIGEIHLARGEVEQARQRFARALRISPENQRALAGMEGLRR